MHWLFSTGVNFELYGKTWTVHKNEGILGRGWWRIPLDDLGPNVRLGWSGWGAVTSFFLFLKIFLGQQDDESAELWGLADLWSEIIESLASINKSPKDCDLPWRSIDNCHFQEMGAYTSAASFTFNGFPRPTPIHVICEPVWYVNKAYCRRGSSGWTVRLSFLALPAIDHAKWWAIEN